jgi:hypothetical protein
MFDIEQTGHRLAPNIRTLSEQLIYLNQQVFCIVWVQLTGHQQTTPSKE